LFGKKFKKQNGNRGSWSGGLFPTDGLLLFFRSAAGSLFAGSKFGQLVISGCHVVFPVGHQNISSTIYAHVSLLAHPDRDCGLHFPGRGGHRHNLVCLGKVPVQLDERARKFDAM